MCSFWGEGITSFRSITLFYRIGTISHSIVNMYFINISKNIPIYSMDVENILWNILVPHNIVMDPINVMGRGLKM
jgi:hypothetical protein